MIKKAMPWYLNKNSFFIFILAGLILFFAGNSCFALDISGSIEEGKYNLTASLRHIKFGKSDISTDFYAAGIILRTKEGRLKSIKGKAWTQASLLNFKPLKEFSADYEISDSALVINSLSWGDVQCQGFVNSPSGRLSGIVLEPETALTLKIKDMDLKDFSGLLGISPDDVELSGLLSGDVKLSGPKDALKIEAGLNASDGGISSLKFTGARMDLEGIWPVLRFVSGQINDVSGIVYELKGQFNLKELSNFNSSEHKVTISSANNTFRFQEWIIKQASDAAGQGVVEAEYPLKNNQSLKMRIKNQEETLGWEKSVKF